MNFEELATRTGVKFEKPQDGIFVWVQGECSYGEIIEKVSSFKLEELDLIVWFLKKLKGSEKKYEIWSLPATEYSLFSKIIPKGYDLGTVRINDFQASISINGECKKIELDGKFNLSDAEALALYEKYSAS